VVPETVSTRHHDATRFKPKKMQKGKELVLEVDSSTPKVTDKTTGPVLEVASSTSAVAVVTPVHEKVDLVLKLKGNAVKEFVSKDSELTNTAAISAAPYVQRQLELGSMIQLVVITLTMVVCCIRVAKYCRAFMTRMKATEDHGDNAKGEAWKCAQKKSPESSARPFLSGEKELKVSLAACDEFGETDPKQEDDSTHGLTGSSAAWASIDSDEGMKDDDDHHLVSLGMESANDIPCVSSLIGSSAWASSFSVSRGAIEATQNSLPRDCPSLASSATSLDSSITSDGEVTNYLGGSSMSSGGGSGISPQSPGRSVKMISFCPSPPQVREYEPYMDGKESPSSATSDDTVKFNNLNKKFSVDTETVGDSANMTTFCATPLQVQEFERNLSEEPEPAMTNTSAASSDKRSILKKTLDVPIEDVEESAVVDKDAQALIGVAMKVAVAVVAVNMIFLTRRR
jgi:hypothetical protein